MKLIDLLVQELPKRGGWPKLARGMISMHADGEIYFDGNRAPGNFRLPQCDDGWHGEIGYDYTNEVTREQYESALAASKQLLWNEDELPPVGIKCLTIGAHGDDSWYECTILAHTEFSGKPVAVFQYGDTISHSSAKWFKPLPTEAERKREGICDSIFGAMSKAERKENRSDMAEEVYDAIAAGKIPGVKLVD